MTAPHPYFVAKARDVLRAAGGDPEAAGPLAEWAEQAHAVGDARVGVLVAEDGQIVGDIGYGESGAWYVTGETMARHGLDAMPMEVGMARGRIARLVGQRLVEVNYNEVCRGQTPGRWSAELAQVETARAALADAEQALRVAVLRAVEAGEQVKATAEAAGVGRQTVYRWQQDAERV